MAYTDHFAPVDTLCAHFDGVVTGHQHDLRLVQTYAGFLAISAVTSYELAIKEIFQSFSDNKHKVLGSFTSRSLKKS